MDEEHMAGRRGYDDYGGQDYFNQSPQFGYAQSGHRQSGFDRFGHFGSAHFGAAHFGAAHFEEGHLTGGVGLMRGCETPGLGTGTGFGLEIMFFCLNIEFVGHNYGGCGDTFNSGLQNADKSGEFSWHQGQQ